MFNGSIADEREVLAVCLDHLHIGVRQVVRSSTRSGLPPPPGEERALSYISQNLEGLDEETLTDFVAKNRERYQVSLDFDPEGSLVCVDDAAFEHVFRDGKGWECFRRTFPESDGTLRFSRVGFDREVGQAMVYAGQQFDWNIGSGGFWLFERTDGLWTESGKLGTWIS